MKISICNPPGRFSGNRFPCPFPSRWTSLFQDYPVFLYYPYELAYLSSLLKRDLPEASVEMIDGTWLRFTINEYVQYLELQKPDWVIFEVDTVTYGETLCVAKQVKEKTGAKIIMAGQYPTIFPEKVIEDGNDYACIGEYEETVLDLLKGEEPCNIQGLYPNSYRKVMDLDFLPDPEDHDIRRIDYSYSGGHRWTRYREIELYASRGCPYSCDFCVAGTVYYKNVNWRFRKPERIINEIENLRKKYPLMEGCFFNEETHIVKKKQILGFCDSLIASGNNDLHYEAMVNHKQLDEEILEAIKQAGYYKLRMGIETVDEKTGESIGRKTMDHDLENVLKTAKKLGIEMYGTFLFGASGSTPEGDRKTIKYGQKLISNGLLSSWQASIAVPHPGTPFYKKCIDNGWIKTDNYEKFNGISGTVVSYPNYSREQIMETVKDMSQKFESAQPFDTTRKEKSVAQEKTLLLKKEHETVQPLLESLTSMFESSQYEKVIEEGKKILINCPKSLYARHAIGSALNQMGLQDKARMEFEFIIKTATDYEDALQYAAAAHFHLGMINLDDGEKEEALQNFKLCMHLNPSHEKARRHYWLLTKNEKDKSDEGEISPLYANTL